MTNSTETVTMLYLGLILDADQKPYHAWAEIDPVANDGRSWSEIDGAAGTVVRWYKTSLVKGARPGVVHTFETERQESKAVAGEFLLLIHSHTREYQGFWRDPDDVRRWQVEHDALQSQLKRQRKAEREMGRIS